MLKKRIIPIELLDGEKLVKSINFGSFRDVGNPIKSSQVYSDQDADELIILNVSRPQRNTETLVKTVGKISQECFVPITAGGGICSEKDVSNLFEAGADKILINTIAFRSPRLITQISERYGQQAIVIGVDVKYAKGEFLLFSDCGKVKENISLNDHIKRVIDAGAGEILLQSIDKDGSMEGYDLELLDAALKVSAVPIIIAGGAGNFYHLKEAFNKDADAAACGSLFNFGDNNPLRAKAFLKNYEIPLKKT